jgi:hypothetical protein
MTRNEARRLENMNPLPGLDEPLQPLNMAPAGEQPDMAANGHYRLLAEEAAGRVVRKELATAYAQAGRRELLTKGPEAMADWETRRVTELARMTIGESQ